MMRKRIVARGSLLLGAALVLLAPLRSPLRLQAADDALSAEIARWVAYLQAHPATGETWEQLKQVATPVLAGAESALRDGRRLLALQRLAVARQYLAADKYVAERSAAGQPSAAAFEAEWARIGQVLGADIGKAKGDALDGVSPAAVRALGEAALPQVRAYYEASLEYGRNTMPGSGLFYIGSALAERDFVTLCRSLASSPSRPAPPLRAISSEIESLQDELLKAYRPPAAIERHTEFIAVSSALKEARELDVAGLRYGALLRYLRASVRFAALRPASAAQADVAAALTRFERRLAADGRDHSIAQLLIEEARADPAVAPAIAGDALPRYVSALEAARPRPAGPTPRVTVTLVRWPYT